MVNVFATVCLHGFLFSFSHFGNRPSRRRDDGRLARCLSRLRRLGGPGVFSCSQNGMSWAKRGYAGIGFTTIRDVMRRFGFELSHTQTMDILNHLEIVVFLLQHPFFICWSDSHLLQSPSPFCGLIWHTHRLWFYHHNHSKPWNFWAIFAFLC